MRRRASHCGPWPRAMSRSSWPRAAAWSKENRLGSGRAGHPQPEALKARGALALALVLAYGGPLGFSADLRPRGPPAVQPLHLVRAVAQDAGCTDPLRSEAAVRVSVAERCVQQTVDKPMLCKCVVFEEQLEEVAAALCARGRTPGD